MHILRTSVLLALLAPAFLLISPSVAETAGRITVMSAFPNGAAIPMEYTCEGRGASPPLTWNDVPPNAKSLAMTVDDPDAPKGGFVHWVVYDIPGATPGLPEGAKGNELPPGTIEGRNGAAKVGWTPPCPPSGRHRYFFRLYALDNTLARGHGTPMTMGELVKAIKGHVLARGELMGTYEKQP